MKTQIIILLFAVVLNLNAQPEEETNMLFGNKPLHIGYFVNPSCQFGEITGSTAVLPSIGAGVIFNNRFAVGLNYKFIASENTPNGEPDTRLYLDQKYMGVKIEYSIFPTKVIHLNFPIEVGMGETELDVKDSYEGDSQWAPKNDKWFGYLEPGIALEINIWKFVKMNFTTSYRFISDVTFRNLNEKDFMGFNYSAGIKIGIF
jgi:hypothetical protein